MVLTSLQHVKQGVTFIFLKLRKTLRNEVNLSSSDGVINSYIIVSLWVSEEKEIQKMQKLLSKFHDWAFSDAYNVQPTKYLLFSLDICVR